VLFTGLEIGNVEGIVLLLLLELTSVESVLLVGLDVDGIVLDLISVESALFVELEIVLLVLLVLLVFFDW